MDFQLTDDQRALKAGMRELLERRFPRSRLRAAVDGEAERGAEVDRELWRELGAAGLFALRVPESAGGVGLGLPEAVLAFEEAGRALLPGPLAATELTAHLSAAGWLAGGGSAAGRWVAEGSAAGALVAGAVRGEAVVTALDQGGALVEHLASADAVLALGATAVEVIPAGAVARSAESIRSVDPATPLHRTAPYRTAPHGAAPHGAAPHGAAPQREAPQRGAPHGTAPTRVAPHRTAVAGAGASGTGASGAATTGVAASGPADRLRREAALLTAAQQLGSASRTVELAVEHAKRRTQFGRPIGAFQAVQHLCAGMLVRAESARSVVYAAAVTEEPGDIAAAKLLADEAAVRNARDCLQVHGGMGFTWEADVHLHLKRAWVRAGQWQCAAEAEEELAAGLLSTVGACL
ncbi:acyl-CoA/acyl-ACP dehydrogenase [Streptomyces hygroscopicus subsp. hygroscopicus]|uniref:acyl-CoA dehydrogenase family protein n=1 Tax=Streptomyces hygroscopicus TaxID=1912 RepID=UPI001C65EA57|nr:acyl-CoA dehydrogenase family protein [Streptomyces hygroscopicus]MBW8088057.1 acyl-CoA/acyl-ACP dehydrogenase [Streptomyces hygroscopicus subsp. hygroscopicus]